ncbi:MAG: tRNA pseudouridine(38-40) synthase TruA [Lachnospiraceae bacterium]|nr:tRNA pseudouridine(38-40) synthase TruA [Lachnospiraceae bacterium]
MRRVLLCVAYDGTDYCGWQYQPGVPTVEGRLNQSIEELTGKETAVIGASRTDAGVHALCNMAVFDTESSIPGDRFSFALNTKLPDDIRIVWSKDVDADFHPRHVTCEKTYEYHIYTGGFMPPMKRLYYWHEARPLDIKAMEDAAAHLVGEHDFKSFCSVDTSALTTVRNVKSIRLVPGDNELTVAVTGNGFLYNMVRIIVGTLVWVGLGVRTPGDVKRMLEAKDREVAGPTAPARGLVLADFKFLD